MQPGVLDYNGSVIHYSYGGHGSKPLICFHGYGETAEKFRFLEKRIGDSYRIIAVDLPFHGETEWNSKHVYPKDLSAITLQVIKKLEADETNIQLLGFSLGGRIALCLLEQMPEKISKLVLMAPDGLTVNFWYWLSTQTYLGNKAFRLTMAKPGWFLGMLRTGNRLGIINQSIYKFVEYYIHDEEVRKELYERWTGLSRCRPDISTIRKLIRKHKIAVELLYGKYDRIIGTERGRKFAEGIDSCRIEVLNCGHQVLHEKNADAIINALSD
ncbi:MAG TPA: alpha/beta hydrolase [Chitinophagaceae bacterium]